jgi:hypothetical protein
MHLFSTASCLLVLASEFALTSAQLLVPLNRAKDDRVSGQENLEQIPVGLGFGWHDHPQMDEATAQQPSGPPLLSDILGIDRSLSIFAGLGRSIESIVPPPSIHEYCLPISR